MRLLRRTAFVFLALLIFMNSVFAVNEDWIHLVERAAEAEKTAFGLKSRDNLLGDGSPLTPGDSVSDWTAVALALSGVPEDYESYLRRLSDYVTEKYAESGLLDPVRATEWHRIALTVLALGGDPTAFGQRADGSAVDLIADGTYACVNGAVDLQGLNGCIYALITLDASGANSDQAEQARNLYVETIRSAQAENGGFGLTAGSSDIDITAMALQALAPYRDEETAASVQRALDYLSRSQMPDGGFRVGDAETCESAAQVVMACCALNLDLENAGLRKPNGTPVDALLSFQNTDGAFSHTKGNAADPMAMSQAMLALAALARSEKGEKLFDFSNHQVNQVSAAPGVKLLLPVVGMSAALIITVILLKKRGRSNR